MAQEKHEFTGKSVDEAIAEGLRALRLRSDQVTIEVLNRGSRGIFGLGSEPAQVRLTPLPEKPPILVSPAPAAPAILESVVAAVEMPLIPEEPPADVVSVAPLSMAEVAVVEDGAAAQPQLDPEEEELAESASAMLTQLVTLMDFQCHVQATWKEGGDEIDDHEGPYLLLNVKGPDLGSLIGRRGETLDNLQYLLRLMINQRVHRWTNIIVDVDGYKERRAAQLHQLALRTATQVAQSGRSVSLEPMPANERRIIHMVLRDHAQVYTESSGEGERRKVHIIAKD
jgi:spoIIIJ-associated protein